MSFQVTTAFVQDYKNTVAMLLQQKGSKLRNLVTSNSYTGKAGKAVEQIGAVRAVRRTARHADTPQISTPHAARWVFPTDYEWADLIDDQDKLRMIIDPTSPYAQNGAMAMGRAIDDVILGALYGTARTGEDGTTNTTFPGAQQVGVDIGGTGSGLNVAKLRRAKRILMANNNDLSAERPVCLVTAADHDALLNEIQVISKDFNSAPVMESGFIKSFLGIDFVHIEFGDTTAFDNAANMVNGSSQRLVPVFLRSGMHLGMWNDIESRIDERNDKGYATQVYLRGTWGATRLEEGRVVQITCA